MPEPARQPGERVELRVEIREQAVRLEPPLCLDHHHLERLLLEQRDRIEIRVEDARNRIRLRERLADECEGRRQRDAVVDGDPLKVGESLARADREEGAPVEARQLASHVLDEPRLIGAHAGQRQLDDQVRNVVCPVLRDRE